MDSKNFKLECCWMDQQRVSLKMQDIDYQPRLYPNRFWVMLAICLTKVGPSAALLWFPNSLYFISYCHQLDSSYTPQDKPVILILGFLCAAPLFFYAVEINCLLGTTTVARICSVCTFISVLWAYFTHSPFIFLFMAVVLPLMCLSLIVIPLLNVLFKYFDGQQNIVTGVANFTLSIANFAFGIAYFYIVNPDDTMPNDNLFSREVALRVPNAILIVGMIGSVSMLVGSFCLLPENQYFNQKQNQSSNLGICQLPLLDPIFQKLYWVTVFLLIPLIYFFNNYKEFMLPIYSDHFLTYLYSAGSISSTLGCLFWGWAAQTYGFGRTLFLVTSVFFLVILIFALSLNAAPGFIQNNCFVWLMISTFLDRSIFVIMAPLLIKVFDTLKGSKLLTLKGTGGVISFGVAGLLQWMGGVSGMCLIISAVLNIINPLLSFTLHHID